ncbi:MAG: alpha-ketoglutarate-dependent dioxygenase AlkB, partial [Bacteroidota bacterium]
MDLFNQDTSKINLLPYDGTVLYHGKIMSNQRADELYDFLFHQVEWKNDEAIIFGKKITTKRKVAWYGNEDYEYTYSNITRQALKWTDELLELKKKIEKLTASTYNSCLINLYHNGDEGVGWHSDDEPTLGLAPTIASVTFGAERKFVF